MFSIIKFFLSLNFFCNFLKFSGLASNEKIFLIFKFLEKKLMLSPLCAPISSNIFIEKKFKLFFRKLTIFFL